jgi:hypothetical protein
MRWMDALGLILSIIELLRRQMDGWMDALGLILSFIGLLRRQARKARDARRRAHQPPSGATKPADRCLADTCWAERYIGNYCLEHAGSKPVRLWDDH